MNLTRGPAVQDAFLRTHHQATFEIDSLGDPLPELASYLFPREGIRGREPCVHEPQPARGNQLHIAIERVDNVGQDLCAIWGPLSQDRQ